MPSSAPVQRLEDIIENIDWIETYVAGLTKDTFTETRLVRDAVERCLARISEAAVKLGHTMDLRYPAIPWHAIRAFGNTLRHGYDIVDIDIVWGTVTRDLSPLRHACVEELTRVRAGGVFEE